MNSDKLSSATFLLISVLFLGEALDLTMSLISPFSENKIFAVLINKHMNVGLLMNQVIFSFSMYGLPCNMQAICKIIERI